MINEKDLLVLSHLRKNGRKTLTDLSKATSMPISTIFEKLKVQQEQLIRKFTILLDFQKLGFYTRVEVMLKVRKEDRDALKQHLLLHRSVNSCYRINNGFDILVDGVFKSINELEEFLEEIDEHFSIDKKQLYFIVESIKEEDFLSSPDSLKKFAS
jgi:Lrp/AsnC family transcriptional regulator for asnA, asnC and gidA